MPGDLSDPESFMPFYYDPKYDQMPNQFEPGATDTDGYIQSISFEAIGRKLGKEELETIKQRLRDKALFHGNMGDEKFRNETSKLVKQLNSARKVASQWLQI